MTMPRAAAETAVTGAWIGVLSQCDRSQNSKRSKRKDEFHCWELVGFYCYQENVMVYLLPVLFYIFSKKMVNFKKSYEIEKKTLKYTNKVNSCSEKYFYYSCC